jgi:hypothetical protein
MEFVPGYALPSSPFLGRFLPPLAEGIAARYLERYSQPGDLIFDPFGQSPQVAVEALRLERRVVVAGFNPISRLALSLAIRPPAETDLRSALTRLADAPKDGGRLEHYLKGLYRTPCAACGAEASADEIEWAEGEPAFRTYTCHQCHHAAQREPVTDADRGWAKRYSAHGLDYHYLLDRVAPTADPAHAHAEEALAVYPPRTQAAIAAVLTRFDALAADREVRRRLAALMVAALEATCVLTQERPRALTPLPRHYTERNFWLALEQATGLLAGAPSEAASVSLAELLEGHAGIHASSEGARELAPRLPAGACALVIAALPRPAQAYWSLSALWSAWLWGHASAATLHGMLLRRRYDWDWHTHALARVFSHARPALAQQPAGQWVGLMAEAEPGFVAAALAAGHAAGLTLAGAALRADTAEAQFLWTMGDSASVGVSDGLSSAAAQPPPSATLDAARRAAEAALHARGEPARWPTLHFGVWQGLAQQHLLAVGDDPVTSMQRRLDPVFRDVRYFRRLEAEGKDDLSTGLWFLPEGVSPAELPLADRVEEAVRRQLLSGEPAAAQAVMSAVCAVFPGLQTPDQNLVRACLQSYAHEVAPDVWQLRPEDAASVRALEVDAILAQLRVLAVKHEFDLVDTNPQAWREGGETVYLFAVTTLAALSAYWLGPRLHARRRFLVLPGGRAELAASKLRRDPRLKAAMLKDNWIILKFRQVRQMAANTQLTRATLEPAFSADPLHEEATQLTLGT